MMRNIVLVFCLSIGTSFGAGLVNGTLSGGGGGGGGGGATNQVVAGNNITVTGNTVLLNTNANLNMAVGTTITAPTVNAGTFQMGASTTSGLVAHNGNTVIGFDGTYYPSQGNTNQYLISPSGSIWWVCNTNITSPLASLLGQMDSASGLQVMDTNGNMTPLTVTSSNFTATANGPGFIGNGGALTNLNAVALANEPANMTGWWRASQFRQTTNGAPISTWTNLVGNGEVLAGVSGTLNQFGANGQPIIQLATTPLTNQNFFGNGITYTNVTIEMVFENNSAWNQLGSPIVVGNSANVGFQIFDTYGAPVNGGAGLFFSLQTNVIREPAGLTLPKGVLTTTVVRFNGTNWDCWENGHQSFRQSIADQVTTTGSGMAADLQLGGSTWNGSLSWGGAIAEVRIFNRALTDIEIQSQNLELNSFYSIDRRPVIFLTGDSETFGAYWSQNSGSQGSNMVTVLQQYFPNYAIYDLARNGQNSYHQITNNGYLWTSFSQAPLVVNVDMQNYNDPGFPGSETISSSSTETNILLTLGICHSNKILRVQCTLFSSLGETNQFGGTGPQYRTNLNAWITNNAQIFDAVADYGSDPYIGGIGSNTLGAPYFEIDGLINHMVDQGYIQRVMPILVPAIQRAIAKGQAGGSGNVSSNAAFTIFSGGASFGGSGLVTSNLTTTALKLTQPISISNVVATGSSPGQLLIVGPGGTIASGSLSTNVSAIGKTVLFYATNVTGIQELVISNTASSNTFELFADGSIVENSAATYQVEGGIGSGNNSFAVGISAIATNSSFAFGDSVAGLDNNSLTSDGNGFDVAIGNGAVAFGHTGGAAFGYLGGNAVAIGFNSLASGAFSYALGANADALTNGSVAIGSASAGFTTALGINACALGGGTTANGDYSTAIGGNFVVTTAGNSIGIAPAGTHLNVIVTNSVSIAATNGVLISGGTNMVSITGGIASLSSNALAAATISFPLTTVKWTNSFGKNIVLYINNSGVTGTAIAENGTTIFTIVSGDCTLYLKPGDYFAETYTAGSPTATWIPL